MFLRAHQGHFKGDNTLVKKINFMQSVFQSIILSTLLVVNLSCAFAQTAPSVIINDYLLTAADISQLKQIYGVEPLPGHYWYDARSGAFGKIGGPVLGVMYPGHQIGQLRSDASNGTSGVFINGRQLQSGEAYQAARLFGYPAPVAGQYWLDANGNIGVVGYLLPMGNIYAAMAQANRGARSGGDNFWTSGLYSGGNYYTGANGQPSQGYVSVPGYGPVSFGMN